MAMALRFKRSCDSMNSRCGSHREAAAGTGSAARAGGQGGAVCLLLGRESLLVGADGVTGDARDPLDLSLTGVGPQKGPDGGLQMWLQDVHSGSPLVGEGVKVTSCRSASWRDRRMSSSMQQVTTGQVEQFGWPPGPKGGGY